MTQRPNAPSERTRRLLIAAAAVAAGAQALIAQTLLIREDLLLYGGNEVALGAFLGLWLLGIVAGALGVRRFEARASGLAVPLLLVQGALPSLAVLLARIARGVSDVPAYEPFPLLLLLVWTVPIAVPVALTTGALVPALAGRARRAGGSVTGVYVAEAAGSLLGGAGTTLLLVAGIDVATLALGCLTFGAAGVFALTNSRSRVAAAGLAIAATAVAITAGPNLGGALRRQHLHTLLPEATLLDHSDTASASLMLAELRGQQVLLVNGQVVAAFPDPARIERTAGVLAALTGSPRRLLVLGTQAADLMPALPAFAALERVVWVVPDSGTRDFAMRHLPGLATWPSLEILVGDPARLRNALQDRAPFDAVWLMVDTPLTRTDDRYVARQTLADLAALLADDGILAVPVRSAENYVGARLRLAVGTVVAGLMEATEHVWLVPGEDGLLLGARKPGALVLSPAPLLHAYTEMQPRESRLRLEGFAALLDPERVKRAESLVASLARDPAVEPSDLDRPLALFNNLLVRAEQEGGEVARLLEALRRTAEVAWVPLAVLGLFALGGVTIRRRRQETRSGAALALLVAGGAVGMGLDLVLLHAYQGRFGTLYLEVGWLFGLLMGGLALGGLLGRWLSSRYGAYGIGVAATATLAALASLLAIAGSEALPLRLFGALAFLLTGTLSGALVPVAESLLETAGIVGARAGVGIEAGDHFGGASAALLLGVLGVPILGLAHTAWIVAGIAAFGLVALLGASLRERRLVAKPVERWLSRTAAYQSFPFRRTSLLLLAISAAAVSGHLVVQHFLLGPRLHLEAPELADAGLAPPWYEVEEPVIHTLGAPPETGPLALASRAAAPHVQGYGGPINLLVSATRDGRILHVSFLEQNETPTYIETIDELFARLEGLSLLEPIRVQPKAPQRRGSETDEGGGQIVDAITAATVTSQAIGRALGQTGERLAKPVFGRAYQHSNTHNELFAPRFMYLAASLLLLVPVLFVRNRWVRRAWLVLHLGVGGIWLGVQLSSVQTLAWLRLEPVLDPLTFAGLLSAIVLLAAAFGPVYCGYLCPAGAAQELLAWFGLARRLPTSGERALRFIKYAVLAVVVVTALGAGGESVLGLDLLREIWAEHRTGIGRLLLFLVAVGSLSTVRFFCRVLCPTGAFLNLSSKVAPLARLLPKKDYTACDLDVRGPPDVDCMQCNRCRVGEHVATAAGWRPVLLHVVTALALLLMVAAAWPRTTSVDKAGPQPEIREVDAGLVKMRTRSGRLSDRRAEYWHVVRP